MTSRNSINKTKTIAIISLLFIKKVNLKKKKLKKKGLNLKSYLLVFHKPKTNGASINVRVGQVLFQLLTRKLDMGLDLAQILKPNPFLVKTGLYKMRR